MSNTMYIASHKDFEVPDFVMNSSDISYQVIDNRSFNLNLMEHTKDEWCEVYQQAVVAINYNDLSDIIGFCHYRRYFYIDQPIDEIFKDYEVILPEPFIINGTVREHYGFYHNILDIDSIGEIIDKVAPELVDQWKETLNSNHLYPFNMYMMKRDDFRMYVNLLLNTVGKYGAMLGDIRKHIDEYPELYIKNFAPNNKAEYQCRLLGFLCERMMDLFVRYKGWDKDKKIFKAPIIKT